MTSNSESTSSASTDSSVDEYALMMEALKELFYYSPPSLAKHSNWTPSIPPAPFWLYDKHLDEKLILRHVKPMKSLKRDISGTVDRILDSLQASEVNLPPIGPRSWFRDRDNSIEAVAHDANSLANFYGATTAFYCHPVASTLAIHPQSPDWITSLAWRHRGEFGPPGFDSEGYAIRFRSRDGKTLQLDPTVHKCMDKDALEGLTSISQRFPVMATWEISDASNRSEELLREMDRLLESGSFRPTLCRTTGHPSASSRLHQPPDALSTPWKIPDSTCDLPNTHRSSSRLKKMSAQTTAPTESSILFKSQPDNKGKYIDQTKVPSRELKKNSQRFVEVSPANHQPLSHCPTVAELLIQHAWTRSVREDASIIVFYCGDFERIGVRHRKSQTLYLSPLIDAARDKLPAYGKIHVGLFIAAYQDTRDRFEQLRALGKDKVPRPMKRPIADENPVKKQTRQRLHPSDDVPDYPSLATPEIFREAGLRHLALIRVEYDVFNSETPGSFLRLARSLATRVGPRHPPRARKKYLIHEYLTLVVGPIIGKGATGITHSAKIEITTLDNRDMEHEVVIKFAFSDEQQERMQHEYSIYDHMESVGIRNGVPEVYGLFKDMEGNTMALVMNHAGKSMWDRRPNMEDVTVTAKPDERSSFLQIMKNIHAAGVRHQDIRPPNLLIDDAGHATILDFDRADLNSSLGVRNREYARLVHLLDGGWLPSVLGIPSDPTISEKNSVSDGSDTGASTPRNSQK